MIWTPHGFLSAARRRPATRRGKPAKHAVRRTNVRRTWGRTYVSPSPGARCRSEALKEAFVDVLDLGRVQEDEADLLVDLELVDHAVRRKLLLPGLLRAGSFVHRGGRCALCGGSPAERCLALLGDDVRGVLEGHIVVRVAGWLFSIFNTYSQERM